MSAVVMIPQRDPDAGETARVPDNIRRSWTRADLAEIETWSAEDILAEGASGCREVWRWTSFARRLVWQYGVDGALKRLNAEAA